jgi:hypothetical protein
MTIKYSIRRYISKVTFALSNHVFLFPLYIKVRDVLLHDNKKRMLYTKDTDLVIEGFPRSANTFSVLAFDSAQTNPVQLAHHLHAASQIIPAAKDNKPILLIVRQPEDAVASFMIMNDNLKPHDALKYYVSFHRKLLPYADRCAVASFESVIKEYNKVLENLNKKYETNFEIFEPTPENTEACLNKVSKALVAEYDNKEYDYNTHVSRPIDERKNAKSEVLKRIKAEAPQLLTEAKTLYSKYKEIFIA